MWYGSIGKEVRQILNNTIMVHADRQFLPEEIELIKWTRRNFKELTRKELAETVCEFLNWKTNSGKLRTSLCLEFLEKMEECNLIKLPESPKKAEKKAVKRRTEKVSYDESDIVKDKLTGSVKDLEKITLQVVKSSTEDMRRWKHYVNKYHMLGEKTIFGDRLYYLIKSGERELGCLSFAASALALEEREKWIGWDNEQKKKNLFLIINNSRFLILPWVKVKNLASKVLSLVVLQIQNDWKENYCYEPVLLETFVDLEHFKGTCYKAANWLCIGETKGRGRMDRYKKYAQSKKAIFMYPLEKGFRAYLKGEIPHKRLSEDEMWW